jgi:two-component system sensor kinase FixL
LYVAEALVGETPLFTGFVRDITARETAEDRLIELQAELIRISQASAIGTMAAALAHELNQPLAVIANYVQSSAALLSRADENALRLAREALDEAGREALRAGAIIERLRQFIARGELENTIVSPNALVDEAYVLASKIFKTKGVALSFAVAPDLLLVIIDRVQIQQVLLNLIRNAFEALGNRGAIVIGARQEGKMMRISVVDNGPGIAPSEQNELFEAFVTSKASGMGLGLTISRAIIVAHGGRIWPESAPGGGAAFHFTVPIAEPIHD